MPQPGGPAGGFGKEEEVIPMPFHCSICGEESTRICARCTKDACDNHLCEKCLRCSDCCECEVSLSTHAPETVRAAMHAPPPEPHVPPAPEPHVAEPVPETPAQSEAGEV
jgi:hypothetical protein